MKRVKMTLPRMSSAIPKMNVGTLGVGLLLQSLFFW
jgi:hypothetical protein